MKDEKQFAYAAARSISGKQHHVRSGKRNGQPYAYFEPSWLTGEIDQVDDSVSDFQMPSDAFERLTSIEHTTWEWLIKTDSVLRAAIELGVTRQAIYNRIRGKNGHGGMIKKNKWVARWWSRREKKLKR